MVVYLFASFFPKCLSSHNIWVIPGTPLESGGRMRVPIFSGEGVFLPRKPGFFFFFILPTVTNTRDRGGGVYPWISFSRNRGFR